MINFGTTCSAGCVRLTVSDAKWIYYNIPRGTIVEFYSSSEPGPLGKPSSKKISDNLECRNWDPTDSDLNNPWNTYKEETTIENNITNNTTNDVIENETNYNDFTTGADQNEVNEVNNIDDNSVTENNTIQNEIENIIDNDIDENKIAS